GLAGVKTQLTTGNNGTVVATGPTGFLRADAEASGVRGRVFWNRSRQVAKELLVLAEPAFDYDVADATIGYGLALPFGNLLDVGGGYRLNAAQSGVFRPGVRRQSLWSVFGEDQCTIRPGVTAVVSGRLDHHPFTGWVASPRGSVIVEPRHGDAIRLSGGRSFRNPTIMQNYLDFTQRFPNPGPLPPNPPFTAIESRLVGNEMLKPERMTMGEAAYTASLGAVRATLVGFAYRLEDVIGTSDPETSVAKAPVFSVWNSYVGRGDVDAWGGEAGIEARVRRWLTLTANYSHERLKDEEGHLRNREAPRHKVNGGVVGRWRRITTGLFADWVGRTEWNAANPGAPREYFPLPAFLLVNANLGCEIVEGLSASVGAFNLLNRRHHEILGAESPVRPGHNGEVIGRLVSGSVSYSF
ncbi:MAG: TonB-dependent receptor, partial [bacterium]